MKNFKKYISDRKEKYRMQYEANIRSDFKVQEKSGSLWLTHNGIAFMKVDENANASDVAKLLNTARNCAVDFEGL